jgi:hypothetical protein
VNGFNDEQNGEMLHCMDVFMALFFSSILQYFRGISRKSSSSGAFLFREAHVQTMG